MQPRGDGYVPCVLMRAGGVLPGVIWLKTVAVIGRNACCDWIAHVERLQIRARHGLEGPCRGPGRRWLTLPLDREGAGPDTFQERPRS